MRILLLILMSFLSLLAFGQENAVIRMQVLAQYFNQSVFHKIDSILLVSPRNTYRFYNLNANEDSLFLIEDIVHDKYDLSIYVNGSETLHERVKTYHDKNFKYSFYLKPKTIATAQLFFDHFLMDSIRMNLTYPKAAKDAEIEGTVWVSFVIMSTGVVDSVIIVRSAGSILDNEVRRVLKSNKTTPIYINGVPTNQKIIMPIMFHLE